MRVHREVQLAVGFAGEQLGVCLRVVAEDDADGAGVGREPAVGRREARAGEQVACASRIARRARSSRRR
jgi:hypothetical protein